MDGIERFAAAARAYCVWADTPPSIGEEGRDMRRLLEILAGLYAAALGLPPAPADDDEPIAEEDAAGPGRLEGRLAALPLQWYSEAADPLEVPAEEISVAELADDLAEIHRTASAGLKLLDAGRRKEAARAWAVSFLDGWGRRAAAALPAIHDWIAEDRED